MKKIFDHFPFRMDGRPYLASASMILAFVFCDPAVAEDAGQSGQTEIETTYVIAGKLYSREDVWKAYEAAREKYAIDPKMGNIVSLNEIGAERISGTLVRRRGAKMILHTSNGTYVSVFCRSAHIVEPGKVTEFSLVKRSATVLEKIRGDRMSLPQYDDATFLPKDQIKALNSGMVLQGVEIRPVESRSERLKVSDRPETQFDRRITTINREK